LLNRLRPGGHTLALRPAFETADSDTAAGEEREDLPRPPDEPVQIGRFLIRGRLGAGGFGVGFLAFDPALRREGALEVPRPETLLTPERRARFQREAIAAAGLDHPNVVPVFESGTAGTVCYIASAYCPGINLAAWLRQRDQPVPVRLAAKLVAQLAEGV